jgi:hypothetical protein
VEVEYSGFQKARRTGIEVNIQQQAVVDFTLTTLNSAYHSMQSKFTRRISKGLDFLAAYTWAKTLTNAGDLLSGGGVGGFRAPALPGFGLKGDYALASFHVKHGFTFSGTYELPVGQSKPYLNKMGGIGDAFLGGWSMNWILSLYSGQPQTISCTQATTAAFGCSAGVRARPLWGCGAILQS